jgi:hypothetical protein
MMMMMDLRVSQSTLVGGVGHHVAQQLPPFLNSAIVR